MTIQEAIAQFLFHCQYEKNLSPKTLKAYAIDLRQFSELLAGDLGITDLPAVDKAALRTDGVLPLQEVEEGFQGGDLPLDALLFEAVEEALDVRGAG